MGFDVGGNKGAVKPAMNVTPLVDVVLVLLIIFMVITPLLTKQFRINLELDINRPVIPLRTITHVGLIHPDSHHVLSHRRLFGHH